eukprot:TRINITY_DN34200_c0_g1_i1.p1 TRINITY_DN34200_c0_g1~~TRINITY_DN34200_c0_g1_i1.p1  ORF type:complete len:195 (-),score=24.41 TRINITY_DN34200_c0_g1_i1:109-693(-)
MYVECILCFFFQAEDGIRDAQESRGLGDVYKRQPPASWGFMDVNGGSPQTIAKIGEYLHGAPSETIRYKYNRAVLFNSELFHASIPMNFRSGHKNRRINFTMLFGHSTIKSETVAGQGGTCVLGPDTPLGQKPLSSMRAPRTPSAGGLGRLESLLKPLTSKPQLTDPLPSPLAPSSQPKRRFLSRRNKQAKARV